MNAALGSIRCSAGWGAVGCLGNKRLSLCLFFFLMLCLYVDAQNIEEIINLWEEDSKRVSVADDHLRPGIYEFTRKQTDPFDKKAADDYVERFLEVADDMLKTDPAVTETRMQYEARLRQEVSDFLEMGARIEQDDARFLIIDEDHYLVQISTRVYRKSGPQIVSQLKFFRLADIAAIVDLNGSSLQVYDVVSAPTGNFSEKFQFGAYVLRDRQILSDWLSNFPKFFFTRSGYDLTWLSILQAAGQDDSGRLVFSTKQAAGFRDGITVKIDPKHGYCPLSFELKGRDVAHGKDVSTRALSSDLREIMPGVWRPMRVEFNRSFVRTTGEDFQQKIELDFLNVSFQPLAEKDLIPQFAKKVMIVDMRLSANRPQIYQLDNPTTDYIRTRFLRPLSAKEKAKLEKQLLSSPSDQKIRSSAFWWLIVAGGVTMLIVVVYVLRGLGKKTG